MKRVWNEVRTRPRMSFRIFSMCPDRGAPTCCAPSHDRVGHASFVLGDSTHPEIGSLASTPSPRLVVAEPLKRLSPLAPPPGIDPLAGRA
jgi:hypothetical protein